MTEEEEDDLVRKAIQRRNSEDINSHGEFP